ncbi:hypothetical protein [Mesorhizobium sp. WSM3859]|uniref:hypothetical protein n=1 Tax=Mesorhizobium sp. WSM3859 TaxID=2029402 RepID=UPI001596C63D|nr:hypothetical protein [Mesorhizobium sp. WSM3859]
MSVLGILLHLGRAVIQAHNNAKVRNLMDVPPPEARRDRGRQVSEKESGAIHRGGR